MRVEDHILETKFIQGDSQAFEILFKLHYTKLTLFANRFTNDLAAAEEIVSDVFTLLWEKGHEITIITPLRSYLFTTVKNRSLNYLKHQKIENLYVNYLEKNNLLNEMMCAVENGYEEKELETQIKQAISTLPEKCREVFVMSRFSDMRYKEIASQLNISPKTVERHMGIALEKLRKILKHVSYMIFL